MNKPTEDQIHTEATRLATLLGGVNLHPSTLTQSLDAKFPNMSDAEFDEIKATCAIIANEVRSTAIEKMWQPA